MVTLGWQGVSRAVALVIVGVLLLSIAPSQHLQAAPLLQGCAATPGTGVITGIVFRDFDADGAQDSGTIVDPPVEGIAVSAYDDTTQLTTTASAADGTYCLNIGAGLDGTVVRVEFTIPASLDFLNPGAAGGGAASSRTTVAFTQVGTGQSVNLGISDGGRHCNSDPNLVTSCFVNGDPVLPGSDSGELSWLIAFENTARGTDAHSNLALGSDVGSTWGLAFQRSSSSLFAGAIMKRHSGFGPGTGETTSDGTGTIYRLDTSGGIPAPGGTPAPGTAQPYLDLDDIFSDATLTGTDPHTGLPADPAQPNNDPDSWAPVGKISLGDIEMSEDDTTLWVMSLNNRTLYAINIGIPPQAPVDIDTSDVVAYAVPTSVAGAPACGSGSQDMRPFGLAAYHGDIYVGVVCSAETSQDPADLWAYVFRLDPAGPTWSNVFDFSLNFPRGCGSDDGTICTAADWNPWMSTNMVSLSDPGGTGDLVFDDLVTYPQPLLSDIEFDDDGSLILAFIDRNGHQIGARNYSTGDGMPILIPGPQGGFLSPPDLFTGASAGDLIRVCLVGGTYFLEQGDIGQPCYQGAGAGNNQGPNGGEYYYTDLFGTFHQQTTVGGIAALAGSGQVVSNNFDPLDLDSGGISWFDSNTGSDGGGGANPERLEIYDDQGAVFFGKAAGLGDVEYLCEAAPIEIGNRVWLDTVIENGRQDPTEAGINGVIVSLYKDTTGDGNPDTLVAQTTTADDPSGAAGHYLFNGASISAYLGGSTPQPNVHYLDANGNNTQDPGEPIGIIPLMTYQVVIEDAANYAGGGPLENLFATSLDSATLGDGQDDIRDSDGQVGDPAAQASQTNAPQVVLLTGAIGANNHTFDFGFVLEEPPEPTVTPPPNPDGSPPPSGDGTSPTTGLALPLLLPELGAAPVEKPNGPPLSTAVLVGGGAAVILAVYVAARRRRVKD